jgi:hypothetical protein
MVVLRSSGAFGGMNVKLANGLTRHNSVANAFVGDGLHETRVVNRCQIVDEPKPSENIWYEALTFPARLLGEIQFWDATLEL